jgi:D-3-phosphoglycerate dehydrogenase
MSRPRVVVTDNYTPYFEQARAALAEAGAELVVAERESPADPSAVLSEADALLVVWLPITAAVAERLKRCKVIVRCGIGYDNIDLEATRARGIPACNVPDYCVEEVADHALSLALALHRQLPMLDRGVREGAWKSTFRIPAFEDTTFGVVGYGRIGRAVIDRARALRFRPAAYDPYVTAAQMEAAGVTAMALDQLFTEADIVSLHTPLSEATRHLVNRERLARMKPGSVLVNTSRGPLVDTVALAEALQRGIPAAAGLDVFEAEPLPPEHPLLRCPSALLTPHVAWYSERSAARLYRMAAEEVVRALRGEPLRSCVNGVGR